MAATLVGGAFLGASFSVLLNRLTSPELVKFFRGRKHDERLLKKLKLKLLGLNKVLNDAESKQFTDRAVKEWLCELKDAVYHAEDLVDEIATEALRCKVEAEYQSDPNQVQSLISSFAKLFDDEIESKLERMIDLLEDFTNEKDVLGLREVVGETWSHRLPTTSLVDETCVYGRENDKEEIMKLVDVHFGERAWVCVSDVFDVLSVTRTIVEAVNGSALDGRDLNSLQRSNGKTSHFVMHDLVHDLAQSVSGDFYYRLEDGKPHGVLEKVRHLSYAQGTFDGFEKFKEIKEAKYLRSLLQIDRKINGKQWLSKKVLDEILSELTHLWLLSLPRYQIMELPYSIRNMIHLRLLDLSYTRINQLPKSLCTLYNLETLLLTNCHLLTTLPAELVKLISLRHLGLSGTNLNEMPMYISRLKDLLELTVFVVGKCSGSGINELKELHRLCGTIHISGLQNVTISSDALEAKMGEKKHLAKLVLEWGSPKEDSRIEREVLEKLEPHTNLKHLEIRNYRGSRFPTWLRDQSFRKMVSLRLENCEFCFSLPPLGQMCSLKELTIARMPGIVNVGYEYRGESESSCKPFESLETLRFEEMSEWVAWRELEAVEFSRLRKLEVIKCPKLIRDLPKKVPSLVRLEIKECPGLEASLPRTTSIRELVLEDCQGLKLEWQGVPSVETLEISSFGSLTKFESELLTLTNMKELKLEKCPRLLSFPKGMVPSTSCPPAACSQASGPSTDQAVGLEKSFNNLKELINNLKELIIWRCERIKKLVVPSTSCPLAARSQASGPSTSGPSANQAVGPEKSFNNLKELSIWWCSELVLPLSVEMGYCNTSLDRLSLDGCQSLKSLPLGLFPKLRFLKFFECANFETLLIPEEIELKNLASLEYLYFISCNNMVSFLRGGLPATNLALFSVTSCHKLKALPEQMHTLLPSLQSFYVNFCPEIESFPEGRLPSKLNCLDISGCKKLVGGRGDWGLHTLPSLRQFTLSGLESEYALESFPEEGLLPSTLTNLGLFHLQNLKSLNRRGLQLLFSLKYLYIGKCPQLKSLPGERLPTSLFVLRIADCPLLKPRCRQEEGEDWHKVAHVPVIIMDGEAIFDQVDLGPIGHDEVFDASTCM
ncbi:hypothetical protein RHSIM_Rhsim03G0031500 [Rhododendron simsii]|uniref:Rx N-terminal domain-containing protein n=1 Tax=Rhododendron simsii TaxID=118357 RepID=A0A834LSL5_RHOSS|nr:hypothetical protein RHSIM_Rhsim03G0031500 [Rhododendron simsii]